MRGYDLVALIFAREISDDLTGLVRKLDKQLDETATKHKRKDRFGVFVILLNDDAGMRQKLKDLAAKEGLKQVVLSSCKADHPKRYKVTNEADLTVAVYDGNQVPRWERNGKVTANFALKKGELDRQKAESIFTAVTKVLPK